MSWKTPKIVEVSVGMEINMYACASRKSTSKMTCPARSAMPPLSLGRRPLCCRLSSQRPRFLIENQGLAFLPVCPGRFCHGA